MHLFQSNKKGKTDVYKSETKWLRNHTCAIFLDNGKNYPKKQRLKEKFQLALFCRARYEHFVLIFWSNHTYHKKFAMAFLLVAYNCMQVC